ncbi:hypothetical protein M0802_007805 [Mischocyttarus mexicanus]|nr:hypothetical protein M0802_007805 [Mischocyttarus mexicanus]
MVVVKAEYILTLVLAGLREHPTQYKHEYESSESFCPFGKAQNFLCPSTFFTASTITITIINSNRPSYHCDKNFLVSLLTSRDYRYPEKAMATITQIESVTLAPG